LVIGVKVFGRTLIISYPWRCKFTEDSEKCTKVLPGLTIDHTSALRYPGEESGRDATHALGASRTHRCCRVTVGSRRDATRGGCRYPMSIILSGQRQLSWPVSCRCSLGWEPPVLWGGLGRPWRVRAREEARRATGRARTRQGRGAAPWGCRRAPCGRARDDDYSASGLMADARGSLRRALSALLVIDLVAGAGRALAGSLPRWPRACLRR
jgi:hypothetical protein